MDASAWVFQANPKKFDIENALSHLTEMKWLVVQHKSDIHTGDAVYLWKSGPSAALLARATVLCEPAELESSPEEFQFCIDEAKFRGSKLRVEIRIDQALRHPVLRKQVLENPALSTHRIFKGQEATNVPLDETAAIELSRIFHADATHV